MTRRKRTGTAGKRLPRVQAAVALYNDRGTWIGRFDADKPSLTDTRGFESTPGSKAHNERTLYALKWIAENRPDLLAEAMVEDEEEITLPEQGPLPPVTIEAVP